MVKRMMKMAPLSTFGVFLLCCSALASTDKCDLHAAVKDEIAVPLNYALTGSEHLRWMHGSSVIFDRRGTKLTEGQKDDVYQNGSLKLTNVDKSKVGTYTPEVYDKDGVKIQNFKSFRLCLLDRVLKPEVKIQCFNDTMVKFTCTVDKKTSNHGYEWTEDNKILENAKGPTLPDKIVKEVQYSNFRCTVFNQVSSMTSDPVQQNCYTSVFPDELFGINIWIIVGGGAGIVVVLIIITIVCCIQNRRKRQMHLRDEEELRLRFTHQHQNHHHHAHQHPHAHNHDHQPAGHTGPRQHRSKQPRNQQRPRDQNHSGAHPQPSPRRPAQAPKAADIDDEKPPPLPQPRKKAPKTPRA
ncbi:uncharacterized protein V6R79_000403 [Siganus canaliculatus]